MKSKLRENRMKRQTQTRRNRRAVAVPLAIIVVLALIVVTVFFYYQLESKVAGDAFSSYTTSSTPVKSFTLLAEDFGYNGTKGGPTLTVNKGDVVRITLIGKSKVSHNLKIDEFNFMVGGEFGVWSGETTTEEFIASTSGVFKYYCRTSRLGGHESLGQFGTIIVN